MGCDCKDVMLRICRHVKLGGRFLFTPNNEPLRILGTSKMPITGETVIQLQRDDGLICLANMSEVKTMRFPGVA